MLGRTGSHRAQHRMAVPAEGNGLHTAPISAARLAAEAAFTAPPSNPAPAVQTQVTVRKVRLAASASPTGMPAAGAQDSGEQARKAPRVFRLDASQAAPNLQMSADQAAVQTSSAAVSIGMTRRSARKATDKRPGPVVHVIHALPVQRREIQKVAQPTLEALIMKLACVEPVLQQIQHAQALVFIDERFSKEWQRCSRRADELHRELKALLR